MHSSKILKNYFWKNFFTAAANGSGARPLAKIFRASAKNLPPVASGGDLVAPGGDQVAPWGDQVAPWGDLGAPGGDLVAPWGDQVAPWGGQKKIFRKNFFLDARLALSGPAAV